MNEGQPLNAEQSQLRRRKKVRSAWISFIGRIVAQIVGATASVALGLMVLTRYGLPDRPASKPAVPSPAGSGTAVTKPLSPHAGLALAVLPIQNYSADAAHAAFADGVTEALITEIAQIAGLQVTSRTSSMVYKGSAKSLPAIARELDVDLILEGSVVCDGKFVRVTAQLIDAASDRHLWARSYDRSMSSVLPLRSELVRSIVQEVGLALRPRIGFQAAR